jgi:hypothetical protein
MEPALNQYSIPLWLGLALVALVVIATGLRVAGKRRWAALVRTHTHVLESGHVDTGGRLPPPARYNARELDGLPLPVQRYFRAVLKDGQPIIAAATLAMTGTMNLSASAEQFKPFTSHQRVITQSPGFLWDAQVMVFPGVPAYVEDSYIAGRGRLMAKVLGWLTVADSLGDGEIARGEFMRYFAEAAWYPTALLPSQGVQWRAVDSHSASASMTDGPITLTLLFRFNPLGLIASVRAEARGSGVGKDGVMVMLPWDCRLSDYQKVDGMLIPQTGEAAWIRPAGRKAYFVGHVKKMRFDFLP